MGRLRPCALERWKRMVDEQAGHSTIVMPAENRISDGGGVSDARVYEVRGPDLSGPFSSCGRMSHRHAKLHASHGYE